MSGFEAKGRYVFGLDAIRATAIVLVLMSHLVGVFKFFGVAGVELFFVLSGHLVGGIFLRLMLSGRTTFGNLLSFWKRRWARTLPSYFLLIPLWLALVQPHELSLSDFARYALFLQNFAQRQGPFYPVSWSLAIEEWFYVALPLFSLLAIKCGINSKRAICGVAAILIVGSFIIRLIPQRADAMFDLRMVVIYHLDGVAIGVIAAVFASHKEHIWRNFARIWIPSVVIFLVGSAALQYLPLSNLPASAVISIVSLSCVPIISRATLISEYDNWISKSIRTSANLSYILYLIHYPIFVFVITQPGYDELPIGTRIGLKFAAVVVIFALVAAVHVWFEKPLLERLAPRGYRGDRAFTTVREI